MLLIKIALKLDNPEKIKKEIKERNELISKMVGNLYPFIVFNEIIQLQQLYYNITKKFDY